MLINIFHGIADLPISIMIFAVYISMNSSAIKNFEVTIDHSVKSYNATTVLTFHAMLL